MTKKRKILIALIICFSFLIISNSNKVYAASASITASQTVTQGSSVTITASVTAGSWDVTLEGAGTTKHIVDSTTTDGNASASTSITFTASEIKTYTFNLTGDITDYDTESTEVVNKSCTVTVVAASSSSNDSGSTSDSGGSTTTSAPVLSNLGITPYDFSGFKSGTTSYSVTVPNSCTTVTIYATTSSSGASISGTGAVTLKEGTNKYTVTVSNSAGSKSYTISIIRQSEENEIVANTSEEETDENEETSTGIGLDSLTITGYELNEEFDINTYEYTVSLSEEITEKLLEEIKEKIFWTANSEDINVEYEIEALEDGTSGTITLVVKDEEKEYSRYVITFINSAEEDEDEEIVAVAGTTSNNNSGTTGGSDTSDSNKKIIGFIVCICLLAGGGIYFAIRTYVKERKSEENEEFETTQDEEPEENNLVESILRARENEFPRLESEMPENIESINTENNEIINSEKIDSNEDLNLEKAKTEDLIKDTREKLSELNGYRKFRKGFSSGKH